MSDVAVQEFGALEAVMELAKTNGLSVSDIPTPGSELLLQDVVYDKTMADYCRTNGVSPATQRDDSGIKLRIFAAQFTKEFK